MESTLRAGERSRELSQRDMESTLRAGERLFNMSQHLGVGRYEPHSLSASVTAGTGGMNWAGNVQFRDASLLSPSSVEELQVIACRTYGRLRRSLRSVDRHKQCAGDRPLERKGQSQGIGPLLQPNRGYDGRRHSARPASEGNQHRRGNDDHHSQCRPHLWGSRHTPSSRRLRTACTKLCDLPITFWA